MMEATAEDMKVVFNSLNLNRRTYELANVLYGLVEGSTKADAAACVHVACCIKGEYRPLRKILDAAQLRTKGEITEAYRRVKDLPVVQGAWEQQEGVQYAPEDVLEYLLDELEHGADGYGRLGAIFSTPEGIREEKETKAKEILRLVDKKDENVDMRPKDLAAAALYIAAIFEGDRHTQKDIADVACTSTTTLRRVYKWMASHLDLDIVL